MQYSVKMHPKIPDRFVSSLIPPQNGKFSWSLIFEDLYRQRCRPVLAYLLASVWNARRFYFSPKSPRFLAPLKPTAWCLWCRICFPPKRVGKQFWGNWDSYGNSSVWIGKIHLLMVHFSITMSGFQNGKYITMEGMFKRLTPLCHLPATRVWRSLTHLGWILSSPWDVGCPYQAKPAYREIGTLISLSTEDDWWLRSIGGQSKYQLP